MSRFLLTIEGKQLQKRSVEKLVRSLKDLKKKGEVDITVKADNPPTSRAARLEAALSQVTEAASEVGELRDELQEWYDNLPEQFQDGEKGGQLQNAIDELDSLVDELEGIDGGSVEFPGMY
jgi:uncharacterized protein with WD repeat